MTINEFLLMFNERLNGAASHINKTRPRVKCRDGYTVSVQAGYGAYSCPRRFSYYFSHVELGYPSDADSELLPYAEDKESPTGSIYATVPVEIVDEVLNKHGGIEGPDYSNGTEEDWKE